MQVLETYCGFWYWFPPLIPCWERQLFNQAEVAKIFSSMPDEFRAKLKKLLKVDYSTSSSLRQSELVLRNLRRVRLQTQVFQLVALLKSTKRSDAEITMYVREASTLFEEVVVHNDETLTEAITYCLKLANKTSRELVKIKPAGIAEEQLLKKRARQEMKKLQSQKGRLNSQPTPTVSITSFNKKRKFWRTV